VTLRVIILVTILEIVQGILKETQQLFSLVILLVITLVTFLGTIQVTSLEIMMASTREIVQGILKEIQQQGLLGISLVTSLVTIQVTSLVIMFKTMAKPLITLDTVGELPIMA